MPHPVRPLSPHLSIYRWQITSVLSILHRLSGVALYAGTLLLLAFLFVVAYAPMQYAQLHELLSSALGRLLLFGWTLAFFFHFYNGIRHLFWDIGKGFEVRLAAKTGWLVLCVTLFSTLAVWAYAYHSVGAL